MINVYQYTDYRKFIQDYHTQMKRNHPRFSFRALAQKSNINAGNFSKVLQGERNLTLASGTKLARVLTLNKKENEYFLAMILFGNAKNHEDKKHYFEKMMSFKKSSVRIIDAQQYEFYDKWYYTAVREALAFFPLNDTNYTELGKFITPAISEREVSRALTLLLKLGLIEKNTDGYYQRKDALISTGNNVKSIALNNFVINTMKLAEQAINRGAEDTNLSAVTISIARSDFEKVQEEVRTCRRKIMEIAKNSESPDRVYQYTMQVFALTKHYDEDQQ